jgi:rhodanese-related sulfurtransferase
MIKQITCKEIKEYLKKKPKSVLLDVRTQEEWNNDGKPDGDKIGLKTYFLEIRRDSFFDFVQEFKNLNINQDKEILVICKSGERSQISAELLSRENYKSINISDGFMGSQEGVGWKKSGLPSL